MSNVNGSSLRGQPNKPLLISGLGALRNALFSEDAEDIDVIGLVVILTIVGALLAVQMEFYGTEASKVLDRAQQYSILSMGVKVRGEIESSYAWNDAYRQWLDWESRAALAEQSGDAEAAARYRVVRDRVATLTPLLGAEYFDSALPQPDLRAFEASTYLVESTAFQERYTRAMELFGYLDEKSGLFAFQIQLLALALALIALAPNQELLPSARLRRLSVFAAAILGAVVVVWAVRVSLEPVPIYSEEAVNQYAIGVGLSYQGDHAGAAAAFDQTLAREPDYANALYRRGNAHFALGNYAAAAADFAAAWDAGREELNVLWNLGWTHYMMGDYEAAIATTNQGIALDAEQAPLYFNLGVMQLAAGDIRAAQGSYATGLQKTTETASLDSPGGAPPTSLWSYLNVAIEDIDAYLTCLETEVCANAPAHELLREPAEGDAELRQAAADIRRDIKNYAVALEYTQAPPPAEVAGEVGALEFGTGVYDENGQITDFLALGAEGSPLRFGLAIEEESNRTIDSALTLANDDDAPVLVRFPYREVQGAPLLVVKIYHNRSEAIWLRIVESWNLGSEGEAVLPLNPSAQFALADGDYHVEIYLDGRLMGEGSFVLGS